MAKGGDFVASWALHIHEVGLRALHQALLVLPFLVQDGWRRSFKRGCSCGEVGTAGKAHFSFLKIGMLAFFHQIVGTLYT